MLLISAQFAICTIYLWQTLRTRYVVLSVEGGLVNCDTIAAICWVWVEKSGEMKQECIIKVGLASLKSMTFECQTLCWTNEMWIVMRAFQAYSEKISCAMHVAFPHIYSCTIRTLFALSVARTFHLAFGTPIGDNYILGMHGKAWVYKTMDM